MRSRLGRYDHDYHGLRKLHPKLLTSFGDACFKLFYCSCVVTFSVRYPLLAKSLLMPNHNQLVPSQKKVVFLPLVLTSIQQHQTNN
jgi:hypothetical protein